MVFLPKSAEDSSTLACQAETDSEGRFAMRTHLGAGRYQSGMQSGEYRVTVTKLEVVQDMRRTPRHLLPKKYRLANTTDLAASVEPNADNQFDFVLEK